MGKKYQILSTLFVIILLGVLIYATFFIFNTRVPLFQVAKKTDVINPWGWDLITFEKDKGLNSYYFKKHNDDTIINLAFEYFRKNKHYKGHGLGGYDLIKEYPLNNSLINVSLTIEGDTLYINQRPKTDDFFSLNNGEFIKGKYYYYYILEKHKLDSCQILFFEKNKDSLLKAGENYIPRFDERCEIIE